ncbi:superoxide dismutase family protein [Hyphomonas atlantica]|uniref:superoxide dismutase family protein n=1 Tax=Hyphomonas atlantica TaxID=1280948 RepID=UPI0023F29309|nr:superoxide dismutase family protein [Hyphomonas atlantica]
MITRTAFAALAIALTACGQQGATPQEMPKNEPTLPGPEGMPGPDEGVYPSMMTASATLIGSEGNEIGTANFLDGPNGEVIRIELNPDSLSPGWHGLHLHAVGTCEDVGEFKESGGHHGKVEGAHGLLNPKGPEAGDLPNIWVAADGSAGYEAFTRLTALDSLLDEDGSAIIIHAQEDDHLTQPIGGAGARVACGVIQ